MRTINFSKPWQACRCGEGFEINFPKVRVVPYGKEDHSFEAPAVLEWSFIDGVTVRVPHQMSSQPERPATDLGSLLYRPEHFWSVEGETANGVRFSEERLSPDGTDPPEAFERVGSSSLVFRPLRVALRHKKLESPFGAEGGRLLDSKSGVIKCDTRDMRFETEAQIVDNVPIFGSTRHEGFTRVEGDGYEFLLRRLRDDSVQCWLQAMGTSSLPKLSNYLTLGLSLATGAPAEWVCSSGTRDGEDCIELASLPPRFGQKGKFAPLGNNAMLAERSCLGNFLSCVIETCMRDEERYLTLRQVALCWDVNNTTMQALGLVSSAVLEGLLNDLPKLLQLQVNSGVSKDELHELKAALSEAEGVKDSRLLSRLLSMVDSMSHTRSKDILNALSTQAQPLFSKQEVKAWGKLRNTLAPGSFWYHGPPKHQALKDQCFLVRNMINKAVLALVGYGGFYCDYSKDYGLCRFEWDDSPLRESSGD